MVHVALVCASLLAGQVGDRSPSPPDLRAYEALRLKAGKAPQAQVKLRSGARRMGWMPSGSSTWRRRCWPTPRTRRHAA